MTDNDEKVGLITVGASAGGVEAMNRLVSGLPSDLAHPVVVVHHRILLTEGPTENGHRPAINALFRSAALAYGSRAVSVLLSGVLDDGVLGSAAIKSRGGVTIAQTPSDALFPAMPANAIAAGVIDHQAPVARMGDLIATLANRGVEEHEMKPDASIACRRSRSSPAGSRTRPVRA